MMKRMNGKKAIKAISIVLSVYMALSPIAVYADELPEEEVSVEAQAEVSVEAANNAEENNSVEEAVISEINNIENESIREATEAIVNVNMNGADNALDQVTELVDNALTDEEVADEIVATADALILIYDAQATAALNALKTISVDTNTVTVSDNGEVIVDWETATDDIAALYNAYQIALVAEEGAKATKDEAVNKRNAASEEVDKLNSGVISNNKEASEAISKSKQNKDNTINEIIASVAEAKKANIANKYTFDEKVNGSDDFYRFYINKVEKNIAYGCLTYYDSEKTTILRKNFKISPEGIEYDYVPKDEWVKENPNCKTVVFGNGGNYVGAYVEDLSEYTTDENTFDGGKVSNIMRKNVSLNKDIDERNQILNDLETINQNLSKLEEEWKQASEVAANALKAYEDAVAMYKKVEKLENEIKESEVEKAKFEYVKAEVDAWKKQQALEKIKESTENAEANNKESNDRVETRESVEVIIDTIASNLGVESESVEELVVKAIIDTENSYAGVADDGEESAVLGVRRNDAEVEEIRNTKSTPKKETVEDAEDTQYVTQELVTIEDEEVPLAYVASESGHIINWWLSLIIVLSLIAVILLVVIKRDKEKEA